MSAPTTANPTRVQLQIDPNAERAVVAEASLVIEEAVVDNAAMKNAAIESAAAAGDLDRHRRNRWIAGIAAVAIAAFAVILWGGYTQGWAWTGVSDQDTLWHWMQLLMVPIAFAALPVVLREHQAMRVERKLLMVGVAVAFVAFVVVSYVVPLDWTGFTGNTLWDWLSLLLLPIAIISVRFLRAERTITWAHYTSFAVVLIGFGVLIVFGYVAPWDWTGFTGNTFLDWMQLLILPILFPTVIVPAAAAWLTAKRAADAERAETADAGNEDAAGSGAGSPAGSPAAPVR